MRIKVAYTNGSTLRRFTIPVPYFILRWGGWLAGSPLLWSIVQRRVANNGAKELERTVDGTEREHFIPDQRTAYWIPTSVERQEIKVLLQTMQYYKGLTIVEVAAQDGTEVSIKL